MARLVQERRKYLRVETPLSIRVIKGDKAYRTTAKDISPLGLRFGMNDDSVHTGDLLELRVDLPESLSPVHAEAKVVWKKRLSEKEGAESDIGCEFTRIEEDNKNTFLKYFCDLLYGQAEAVRKEIGGEK